MEIKLDGAEMLLAGHAGLMRQVQNLRDGRKAAYGAGNMADWQLHIEGAMCEMAVAKRLGCWWPGKGTFRGDDAGDVQVRGTAHGNGRLILHKEDADHDIFWLVTGINGHYWVRGWITGHEGKQEKYWTDPGTGRPAFFVPQEDLKTE